MGPPLGRSALAQTSPSPRLALVLSWSKHSCGGGQSRNSIRRAVGAEPQLHKSRQNFVAPHPILISFGCHQWRLGRRSQPVRIGAASRNVWSRAITPLLIRWRVLALRLFRAQRPPNWATSSRCRHPIYAIRRPPYSRNAGSPPARSIRHWCGERLLRAVKPIFRSNGMTALARTPVLPETASVGALSAHLRLSLFVRRPTALDPKHAFPLGPSKGSDAHIAAIR
jgi:hypothetical protein